jgi:HSP20 family protein
MSFLVRRNFYPESKNFNDLFENFFRGVDHDWDRSRFSPTVNLKEDDEKYTLWAELAGVNKEDMDITLKENILTIKGEKKFEDETNKEGYHRIETRYGSFSRSFELPGDIDEENVSATYTDGVLKLDIFKQTGPIKSHKKIEIQ